MAIEYSKLTKTQRLAAFLITVGPESAGMMMKNFASAQLELICREIAQMPVLHASVQSEALREFSTIVSNGLSSSLGGVQFAQTMLGQAKDESEAAAILNRCAPVTTGAGAKRSATWTAGSCSPSSRTSNRRRSPSFSPVWNRKRAPNLSACSIRRCARRFSSGSARWMAPRRRQWPRSRKS